MGERIINTLFNTQDKYKEMNIINPYKFGGGGGTGLKENLVSAWEFDETSGITVFDAHGSNDGTNIGATINQTGKLNKAYDFDRATEDYVSVPDSTDLSVGGGVSDVSFSISAWINPNNFTNRFAICCKGVDAANNLTEYVFFLFNSDGRLSWQIYDGIGGIRIGKNQTTGSITSGSWHHVVGTYDGSSSSAGIKLYINGSEVSTTDNNSGTYIASHNTSTIFTIGGYWVSDTDFKQFGDGLIDQLSVWKGRELSSSDVSVLYNSGNGLAYTSW